VSWKNVYRFWIFYLFLLCIITWYWSECLLSCNCWRWLPVVMSLWSLRSKEFPDVSIPLQDYMSTVHGVQNLPALVIAILHGDWDHQRWERLCIFDCLCRSFFSRVILRLCIFWTCSVEETIPSNTQRILTHTLASYELAGFFLSKYLDRFPFETVIPLLLTKPPFCWQKS
jgi:hypothetical protein